LGGWFKTAGRNAVPSSSSRYDEASHREDLKADRLGTQQKKKELSVCDEFCTLTAAV